MKKEVSWYCSNCDKFYRGCFLGRCVKCGKPVRAFYKWIK